MDADRGVSESHGSDHGAEEDDRVAIAQVHRVTFGNKAWYPDIQTADNRVFFKIDKHDRELTKITLGKGINRHKNKGEIRTLSKLRWLADMHALRKQACNSAIHDVLRAAITENGDDVPANFRFRDAREDDKWLVRKEVVELHCPALDNYPATVIMALWQIRGPLFLELTEECVKYCVAAIKQSPEAVPCSPKRKRKKKHRRSASTPRKAEHGPARPMESEPAASEAPGAD